MNCFVAGTMVCTIQGSIPIEEIQPGDYVLSTDPETGDTTYKMVLETYENTAEELVHISVGEEKFVTTTGHPFYVENRGWTEAGELKREDNLLLSTGEWVEISNIKIKFSEEAVAVYNFAVEDYHTYHVGELGVLVHNACGVGSSQT